MSNRTKIVVVTTSSLFLIGLISYAIATQDRANLILYFFTVILPISALVAIAVGIIEYIKTTDSFYISLGTALLVLASVALTLSIITLLGISLYRIFSFLFEKSYSGFGKGTFALLIAVMAGGLLFAFRLRFRSIYGAVEMLSGVAFAAFQGSSDHSNIADWQIYFSMLTAVYLIVRGLDNIHQGVTKEPYDKIALKYWKRYLRRRKLSDEGAMAVILSVLYDRKENKERIITKSDLLTHHSDVAQLERAIQRARQAKLLTQDGGTFMKISKAGVGELNRLRPLS